MNNDSEIFANFLETTGIDKYLERLQNRGQPEDAMMVRASLFAAFFYGRETE